ncbi:recQ-mediated genome instability protein 1-like [Pogonomyrmex barbatus]|uniref:RecQ-mediated genome instability protein 1 n=1 Tax=Pogonomyrmex barbatus TaxID=144034 RepID=A0A6I9WS62_9HYME|nr:recQ-mediated genome instability protein 1-like [Pogonomyrmex barbatus]
MNESLLRRIKRQLNAKFYVMNNAWLKDCVEFFIRDKMPQELMDKHIFEFVESQWQLSDLREISNENGCLPKNLAQQAHIVLTDTYILQVDKMYDIASSKYKQLCEIRKINNDNLEIMEEEKLIERQKARRMMQLCLTDGVQDVTAIEYTPLKQINGTLLPGYKVMIIGPINCRRGIILLEDGKYKEIGGEVESLLKPNALENVLARALGEIENFDPYNDIGPSKMTSLNPQNTISNNKDNFFDDDFEEAVNLEAVTAIERQNQEVKPVKHFRHFESACNHRETRKETDEIMEEILEDIDFEPLENWPNKSPMKFIQTSSSQIDTKKVDKKNIIIKETFTRDSRSKPLLSADSIKKKSSEFPDDDFHFNDCDIKKNYEGSLSFQQNENPSKSKNEFLPLIPQIDRNALIKEKHTPIQVTQSEKLMLKECTSRTVQQIPKTEIISNTFAPSPIPKIYDLSDVLREPIIGKVYKTVRGQVKSHSALTKQGKCWSVTALITDHTSSVEVCFDTEILEEFLGFTVQEFLQKKKLAKLNFEINNELRLSLRKAQHKIQNLDAFLKLELAQDQIPKIVGITQLTT